MAYQNPADQSTADKGRERSELQRNIIMLEADKGKKNTQKIQFEAEIRAFKKSQDRIQLELQEKQKELQKIDQEVAVLDVSIKNLKKKLNSV